MDVVIANKIMVLVNELKERGYWSYLAKYIDFEKDKVKTSCIATGKNQNERDELAGEYKALDRFLYVLDENYDKALSILGADKDEKPPDQESEQAES